LRKQSLRRFANPTGGRAILAEPVKLIGQEKGLVNLGDAYKLVPGYQLAAFGSKRSGRRKIEI
jgi:hypothetical protein